MRIAVYTLTRDRLEYSKRCFETLKEKAGLDFHHYVVDNGSEDGTQDWLKNTYKPYWFSFLPSNYGISKASNLALNAIKHGHYNIIAKVDNDCLVHTENILGQIGEIFGSLEVFHPKYMLSPRVEGIVNQPKRGRYTQLAGRRIGLTAIIGGLFQCSIPAMYQHYQYPEDLPLAKGQDDSICHWFKTHGGEVGYIEDLVVEHLHGTDNQALEFPDYFLRKVLEESNVPD